ncbi:hypothetical protein [Profundibacterium mesophilum]|nr:hypothetical protein [Profundibacterium mesophilum]
MIGFSRIWMAAVLTFMLASTPSMAEHMGGQAHEAATASHAMAAEPHSGLETPAIPALSSDLVADCQSACCSGICAVVDVTVNSGVMGGIPPMRHEPAGIAGTVSVQGGDLLRPPQG